MRGVSTSVIGPLRKPELESLASRESKKPRSTSQKAKGNGSEKDLFDADSDIYSVLQSGSD